MKISQNLVALAFPITCLKCVNVRVYFFPVYISNSLFSYYLKIFKFTRVSTRLKILI